MKNVKNSEKVGNPTDKTEYIDPTPEEKAVSNTLGEGQAQKDVKRRFVRVQFDIEYGGTVGKAMDSKSKTMPDMHMTVKQLLENHSRGLEGKVEVRQPLYFETEIPTLNDITDVQEYKESLMERLKNVDKFIKHEKSEKERKEREEREKEARKAAEKVKTDPVTGQTSIPD